LNFPFRRYQIQRVYRGERAQKGRYREFYQADIDVIGKETLALGYDAELPAVIYGIFSELAFGAFTIYLNNRRLLRGLLETFGIAADGHRSVLHEIDRLGKQDTTEVIARLVAVGVESGAASELIGIVTESDAGAAMERVKPRAAQNAALEAGRQELMTVYQTA